MLDYSLCKQCVWDEWRKYAGELSEHDMQQRFEDWWAGCWTIDCCPCKYAGSYFDHYASKCGAYGTYIGHYPPSECPYMLEHIMKSQEVPNVRNTSPSVRGRFKNVKWDKYVYPKRLTAAISQRICRRHKKKL